MKRLALITLILAGTLLGGCKLSSLVDTSSILDQLCQSYPQVCQYLNTGD